MKSIKTIDCVVIYNLLKGAKLGQMASADKFNVLKTSKALKGISEAFEDFRTDASERLKGDEHDEIQRMAGQWQSEGDKCGLSDDEKKKVNAYYAKYGKDLNDCLNEEAQKVNEDVDVRTITEDGFGKLAEANDTWTVEQLLKLEELLVS